VKRLDRRAGAFFGLLDTDRGVCGACSHGMMRSDGCGFVCCMQVQVQALREDECAESFA
jgi:hypothetical protein